MPDNDNIEINYSDIDSEAVFLIEESLARKYSVMPLTLHGDSLYVAMADTTDIYALDDIKLYTGRNVIPAKASSGDITAAIEKFYGRESAERAFEDFDGVFTEEYLKQPQVETDKDNISSAPVVRAINLLLNHAVNIGASDIHIEPSENDFRIRLRIDGELLLFKILEKHHLTPLTIRLKIMAGLDIAEQRKPQDGGITIKSGNNNIDIRISILPTIYGEKSALRILGSENSLYPIEKLGFNEKQLETFKRILMSGHGMLLVAGPTGSGKTTTLYSALNQFDKDKLNIITLEDPVEYKIHRVTQLQTNNKIDFTFANGLRSILRQDPDIIMIGEIRDNETAQIAVRAAITGRLVFSTVHTGDAASTIIRLFDMEVEPYLLSSSLIGVVAQRLIRKICPRCKAEYIPDELTEKYLGDSEKEGMFYIGSGCGYCGNTGYSGRVAVHETVFMDKDIRKHIKTGSDADEMREFLKKAGIVTLSERCLELVKSGVTTVDEYLKVKFSI